MDDDEELIILEDPKPAAIRCRGHQSRPGCINVLKWSDCRSQFARARKAGLTILEARNLMPLCRRCMTCALGSAPIGRQ
jgi:hypothetical protein